jgi:hypothetical protein
MAAIEFTLTYSESLVSGKGGDCRDVMDFFEGRDDEDDLSSLPPRRHVRQFWSFTRII